MEFQTTMKRNTDQEHGIVDARIRTRFRFLVSDSSGTDTETETGTGFKVLEWLRLSNLGAYWV